MAFLCTSNAFAEDSAFADLHKGTLTLPCVYVNFADADASLVPVNVEMIQRGSSMNWKVVGAAVALTKECQPYVEATDEEAGEEVEEEAGEEAE